MQHLRVQQILLNMSVDKIIVGLKDEQEIIKDKLTRGTVALDVVSIVGMGGLGKTTMAKKVYQELDYHFHIRAFCCVSQTYDKRKLLLEILSQVTQLTDRTKEMNLESQVTQLTDRTKEMSFEDLGECLYQKLKGKRYLIVVDDMWEIATWNDLGIFFPNDRNQSRILITSRQSDVVSQVKQASTLPHCLRLLSEEDSWKLLEKEAFHEGSCPPDLLDLGKKIAKSCQGLPLAIVVVAGILARTVQEPEKWEQIALNVSTYAQIECLHIFELSYNYLPQHLKPCFLYLAAFEEDAQIPVPKLIKLWIAEGFVPGTEDRCSEDLGEEYLMGLVGRNLVMVSERRSIGGIKKCHVHDLMLDFCLRKARDEKLIRRLEGYGWLSAFRSLGVSSSRLCCYYKGESLMLSKFLFSPHLSSLLLFGGNRYWWGNDCTFVSGLKHLTVLELAGLTVKKNFFDMKLPAKLRYLAVYGYFEEIPPSISRLSKLETLVVDNGKSVPVIHLPDSIWEMVTLRHLCSDGRFYLPEPRGGKLENLQTLNFICGDEVRNQALEAVPNLRNLKCFFDDPRGLPKLDFLSQLSSLHFFSPHIFNPYRGELAELSPGILPSNLRKLTVTNGLFYKCIHMLPNLEVLKIRFPDFASKRRWCMTDDENFGKLKYFELSGSRIEVWDASKENFPRLEKLVMDCCVALESIPSSFGEIPTLQLIDVRRVRQSVVSSARQIQEDQKTLGNEELKVEVSHVLYDTLL